MTYVLAHAKFENLFLNYNVHERYDTADNVDRTD